MLWRGSERMLKLEGKKVKFFALENTPVKVGTQIIPQLHGTKPQSAKMF